LGALIGGVAVLSLLPSWYVSGVLTPVDLIYVALGWNSEPRRWLLWVALVLNAAALIATTVVWLAP
jgi:hypothetical protein